MIGPLNSDKNKSTIVKISLRKSLLTYSMPFFCFVTTWAKSPFTFWTNLIGIKFQTFQTNGNGNMIGSNNQRWIIENNIPGLNFLIGHYTITNFFYKFFRSQVGIHYFDVISDKRGRKLAKFQLYITICKQFWLSTPNAAYYDTVFFLSPWAIKAAGVTYNLFDFWQLEILKLVANSESCQNISKYECRIEFSSINQW